MVTNFNPSQGKRLFFLESRWDLGGSTVFNAMLAGHLLRLDNYALGGFSIDPVASTEFLTGLIDFPIYHLAHKRFTRRRILLDMYGLIRSYAPDYLIFTITRKNCEIARHLPEHVVKIGVIHAVDQDVIATANLYSGSFDAIVSVSQMGLDALNGISPPPACPSRFIPPGIMLPDAPLEREANTDQPIRLLYLGRLAEPSKRARSIVSIAKNLKSRGIPFTWTVAGDGPEAGYLAQALAEMGIAEVLLLGSVRHKDLPALFSRHDMIVSTSDKEAFPLALQESMAFGLVPVAGNAPGRVEDVVTAAGGFLVSADDPAEFGGAIAAAHENRELLYRLSAQAAQTIQKDLGWECIGGRWQALLVSLAPQRGIEKAWPLRLTIKDNLYISLPIYLKFAQSWGEFVLSQIELYNRGLVIRLRRMNGFFFPHH